MKKKNIKETHGKLCMQCRTREVWLDGNYCFKCYMKKTDPTNNYKEKRESYSVLDLPGKKIKTPKKN